MSASWIKMRQLAAKLAVVSAIAFFVHAQPAVAAGSICFDYFAKGTSTSPAKIAIKDTATSWFSTVEFGDLRKKVVSEKRSDGIHRVVESIRVTEVLGPKLVHERSVDVRRFNIELMPGADPDASSYYAESGFDHKTGRHWMHLYPVEASEKISKLHYEKLDLTWQTYRKEGTVDGQEIKDFKKTEGQLPAIRKIIFSTIDQNGRTLAVMRVFDGTPYPTSYLASSRHSLYDESPATPSSIPVEERYRHIDFREESDFIFEAGRLAKSDEVDQMLEHQFYNFGAYLLQKFGSGGRVPDDYVEQGRVYIEITARHLAFYMNNRKPDDPGFHLFAMSRDGGPMQKLKSKVDYKDLGVDRKNTKDKFILYLTVGEFISRFYQEVTVTRVPE